MDKRIAVVTGGNRGLGLETSRQLAKEGYRVLLTSRDLEKGKQKTQKLQQEGLDIQCVELDVASPKSIEAFYHQLEKDWGRVDVLINNAGVLLDKEEETQKGEFEERRKILEETLNTNVVGAYDLTNRIIPFMLKQNYGRIVNVSSGAGQLSEPHSYYIAYSISKTALNAITCFLAAKWYGKNILINSVCPGWVKTDMGGAQAPRTIEQGIQGIVWAATLPDGGPSGGFFRDGKPISW